MDALQAFLEAELTNTKEVTIERLKVTLVLEPIPPREFKKVKDQATFGSDIDELKFASSLISKSCSNLDFGDKRMLEKFNAVNATECVEKALLMGEITSIQEEILKLSGFNTIDKQVADAKKQ